MDGHDPDDPVETGEHVSRGFLGTEPVTESLWHRYRKEAERFVAAAEALQTITSGG